MEPHFYNVNVTWSSHRKGVMHSPELNDESSKNQHIEVATPPQFPQGMPGIWSPEHLFTAAVSSCFMTTFLAVAESSKLAFKSFSCQSSGKLEKLDGKLQMSEVYIEPRVTIFDEDDFDRTIRILVKAETACLISNSITAKVVMKPIIEYAALVSRT
ncbi:hypothetical protein C900_02143 [Fulvivirga imtechensis AK7]|uniref:OsmC/Ohr family protein n=1 Tax=Fulvivirga imtechensis AK7 TaxID=1237149 RepID=L8JWB2_9BACT|nr:OsmC family protein [Fulvivirga imtechensis]ELR71904.1 hypothetical protein C900_02143 [Fulvivirga imtechensis AK7]